MKLGVITDGISRDFARAAAVLDEFDLRLAELQFPWGQKVGDLDADARRTSQFARRALASRRISPYP